MSHITVHNSGSLHSGFYRRERPDEWNAVGDGDGNPIRPCEQLQLDLPDVAHKHGGGVCAVIQRSCRKQTASSSPDKGLRWPHLYDSDLLCHCLLRPLPAVYVHPLPASITLFLNLSLCWLLKPLLPDVLASAPTVPLIFFSSNGQFKFLRGTSSHHGSCCPAVAPTVTS